MSFEVIQWKFYFNIKSTISGIFIETCFSKRSRFHHLNFFFVFHYFFWSKLSSSRKVNANGSTIEISLELQLNEMSDVCDAIFEIFHWNLLEMCTIHCNCAITKKSVYLTFQNIHCHLNIPLEIFSPRWMPGKNTKQLEFI